MNTPADTCPVPPPLNIVILTGTDAPATLDCVRALLVIPSVNIAGIVYDHGAIALSLRFKRLRKRLQREGPFYLPARVLDIALRAVNRFLDRPHDVRELRRQIFADQPISLRDLAAQHLIPFSAVGSLNSDAARAAIRTLNADLGVVIGTRILTRSTFALPRLGSINLHKGKVPEYRGQPPAFWELYNRESVAGATVHCVAERLDAGDVITQGTVAIDSRDTPQSLRLKLDTLGASLLKEAVSRFADGRAIPKPQEPCTSRPYTTPTRREQRTLDRRFGISDEWPAKTALKAALYRVLVSFGPLTLRNICLRLTRTTRFTVLLYHRVNDHSRDGLTTSVDRFIEHMIVLKRYYNVVSLREAVDASVARRFLGTNVVVITFDDGYADNYELAAPILKHFGLPATFFVTAGLVNTDQPFRHDRNSPYRFANLTWEQVRALREVGFEIGSHGWSHANLAACTLEEARQEVLKSRELLQQILGDSVTSFAYPFGGREDINAAVVDEIHTSGFDIVLSAYGGSNFGHLDPSNIRRSGVRTHTSALALRAHIEGVNLARIHEHRFLGQLRFHMIARVFGIAVRPFQRSGQP